MTNSDRAYWQFRRTEAHKAFRHARDLLLAHRDDHDTACRVFRWPRPSHFNWALEWFDVIAAANDTPALDLLAGDGNSETLSFAYVSAESNRTANWLRTCGVRRGDHVMIVLGQQRELWDCLLACMKIGAVVIPTYTSLTAAEASDRLYRGRIQHIICRDDLTSLIRREVPGLRIAVPGNTPGWSAYQDRWRHNTRFIPAGPTPADDIAFCYFTSGTTSLPKLVAHTHSSYPIGHLSSLYWNGLRQGDRHLNISAPGWAKHSWSSLFVPWNAGATAVVAPTGPLDLSALPRLMSAQRVNSLCAPPSTWQALLPHLDTVRPPLREATSAGEPLPEQVIQDVVASWGVTVRDGYGQSETTAMVGTSPGLPRVPGRLGKPLPGYRIALRGEDGKDASEGEICIMTAEGMTPAGLMAGYLDEQGQLRKPIENGTYSTGDLGIRDEQGYIRVLGRTDDVFKSFGHRVSPYELEAALKTHPAVADAAVIPRTHATGGAVAHAVVELAPGGTLDPSDTTAATLLRYCASLLAPELCPRSIEFTRQLPRTTSEKVRRSALR